VIMSAGQPSKRRLIEVVALTARDGGGVRGLCDNSGVVPRLTGKGASDILQGAFVTCKICIVPARVDCIPSRMPGTLRTGGRS